MQYIPLENESCPECGETPEAFNNESFKVVIDSDAVRCPGCHLKGWISVDVDSCMIHWKGED